MDRETTIEDFSRLPMPARSLEGSRLCRYRVYSTRDRFVLVEAETAADALNSSGIGEPLRIHREVPGREVLVDRKRLLE